MPGLTLSSYLIITVKHTKAGEQYFPVVMLIMLFKMIRTFEPVDEILKLLSGTFLNLKTGSRVGERPRRARPGEEDGLGPRHPPYPFIAITRKILRHIRLPVPTKSLSVQSFTERSSKESITRNTVTKQNKRQ